MIGKYILAFAAVVTLLVGCGTEPRSPAFNTLPIVLEKPEIQERIRSLGARGEFSLSGLGFLNGRLYAGTNLGVLEIDESGIPRLFKWQVHDDVVSEPWNDKHGGALWFFHSGQDNLVRFDGSNWTSVEVPNDAKSTRADVLRGSRGFSSTKDFFFQTTSSAWRRSTKGESWERVPMPPFDCSFDILKPSDESRNAGCFASIAPIDGQMNVIAHSRYLSGAETIETSKARTAPDRMYALRDGKLDQVDLSDRRFIIDERLIFPTNDGVYFGSRTGGIYYATKSGVTRIETPGELLTFTLRPNANLMAVVKNLGVFERTARWEKRFDLPAGWSDSEYFVFLAADDQNVALTITPKRQRSDGGMMRSRLWLLKDGRFTEQLRELQGGEPPL